MGTSGGEHEILQSEVGDPMGEHGILQFVLGTVEFRVGAPERQRALGYPSLGP